MWQDYAFTIASLMFGYSLVPQLIKNHEVRSAEQISWQLMLISLATVLLSTIACYTLKLFLTTGMNLIQSLCWVAMIIQKLYYKEDADAKSNGSNQ